MDQSSSKSSSLSSPLAIVGLFVFAIGLIVVGMLCVRLLSGLDDVKSSLSSVRGDVIRMRTETDGLDRQVNGIKATVESGKKEFGEKLAAETEKIGQLNTKLGSLEGQQATIKSDVKTMGTAQAAIQAQVKTVGTAQAAIQANVKTIATAQTAIKAENAKFAGQLAAEIRRINSLNTKVEAGEKAGLASAAESKRLAAEGAATRAELTSLKSEFGNTDASFEKLVGALSGLGAAD